MKLVEEHNEERKKVDLENDSDIEEIYKIFSPCLIYEAGLISINDFIKLLDGEKIKINF
jgi:hypothetical protein